MRIHGAIQLRLIIFIYDVLLKNCVSTKYVFKGAGEMNEFVSFIVSSSKCVSGNNIVRTDSRVRIFDMINQNIQRGEINTFLK